VLALLIDVQIKRNPGFAQRLRKVQAVLHRHCAVLVCMPDEARRRVFCDLEFVG
jgi:hypothetical protein